MGLHIDEYQTGSPSYDLGPMKKLSVPKKLLTSGLGYNYVFCQNHQNRIQKAKPNNMHVCSN